MKNSDDFNDPLERNMKNLFATRSTDASTDASDANAPRLSAEEKEAMFTGITEKRFRLGWKFLLFCSVLGIAMPLGVVVYEWITQELFAGMQLANLQAIFYNPIPTLGHIFLCALVPVVNLLLLLHLRGRIRLPRTLRSTLAGASLAVALGYMIAFIPLMHVVAIGIPFILIGIGLMALLPLSPHFGALFTVLLSRRIGRVESGRIHRPLAAAGFATGLALLLGFTALHHHRVNTLDTTIAALNHDTGEPATPEEQAQALANLDGLVSERWLEQAVHTPPTKISGWLGDRWERVGHNRKDGIHKIYYAMHGKTIASQYRKPWRPTGPHQWIGGVRDDLRLAGSDMEGWVDSEAGLGYIEWTQEFVNYAARQNEGRQHIELPPGGVVSRVTLWVNGEPREAAFDTVAKTRAAYEYIVARKRDPVLVNAIGPDKIQVECFPVPPIKNKVPGRMKFRLGITFPLPLAGKDIETADTRLRLPRIIDRNFLPADALEHTLRLESQHPVEGLARTGAMTHEAAFAMAVNPPRGHWHRSSPDTLRTLVVPRDNSVAGAFCADEIGGGTVVSRPFANPERTLERVAIVLDTSAPLAERLDPLRTLDTSVAGPSVEVRWFLAQAPHAAGAITTASSPDALRADQFTGGIDAVPALEAAIFWAGGAENSTVVWYHGAQPVPYQPVTRVKELLDLHDGKVTLHSQQLNPVQRHRGNDVSCNFVADYLSGNQLATAHSPTWRPQRAFEEALAANTTGPAGLEWRLKRLDDARGASAPEDLVPTRVELAKLKAHQEILTALGTAPNRADPEAERKAIGEKAIAYELVTPVSAAIVLETREDYLHHGLTPPEDKAAKAAQGGAVPEPSTLLMILLGTGVLFGMRKLREWRGHGY